MRNPDLKAAAERGRMTTSTTTTDEYTAEEFAFLQAMNRYKVEFHRPHPTLCEVLAVFRSMGYRKPEEGEKPLRIDWRDGAKNHPIGRVVDLDTIKPISGPDGFCCFVDEGTGEWKRYVIRDGKWVSGPDGRLLVESGKGRVKFFPFNGSPAEFEAFLLTYEGRVHEERRQSSDEAQGNGRRKDDINDVASELYRSEF